MKASLRDEVYCRMRSILGAIDCEYDRAAQYITIYWRKYGILGRLSCSRLESDNIEAECRKLAAKMIEKQRADAMRYAAFQRSPQTVPSLGGADWPELPQLENIKRVSRRELVGTWKPAMFIADTELAALDRRINEVRVAL